MPGFRLRDLGDPAGQLFDLGPGEQRLGRSSDNDLIVDVPGVSRRHALLTLDAEGLLVEDLGSKNGTFVEGEPVTRSQVPAGAILRFGPREFRLELVHPDDVRLSIRRALERGTDTAASGRDLTTLQATGAASGSLNLLELVEEAACRVAIEGANGLWESVARLTESLGAVGSCLCRLDDGEAFELLAASGETPGEAVVEAVLETACRLDPSPEAGVCFETVHLPNHRPVALAVTGGEGEARFLLALLGRELLTPDEGAVLRCFLRLVRACVSRRLPESSSRWRSTPPDLVFPAGYIPGRSEAMAALYEETAQIAGGDLPVLLRGETGVGKELLAEILHASSPRCSGLLAAVNCAAIPAELLEAELFGIGRGVATGVEARQGWFARADGGTLMLDEIAEMPLALQAKLLRALEERMIRPLGREPRKIDIRVVAATNADLRERVRDGSFRADLFYRIAGHEITIPPLRERPEDIPPLVAHFFDESCRRSGKAVTGVTVRATALLCRYPWPGNVRELKNEVRRLVQLCLPGRAIDSGLLSRHIRNGTTAEAPESTGSRAEEETPLDLESRVARLELSLIREALERTRGNLSRSARLLGISRNGLKQKLERHGLDAEAWRQKG